MAAYRGFSRFLEGLLFATGPEASRMNRARSAGMRLVERSSTAEGFFGRRTGRVLKKASGYGFGAISGKKFMVPFAASMFGLGAIHGFTEETLGSPTGYAIMSDLISYGSTETNPLGRPLGTVSGYEQYPAWRTDAQGNPLAASGELALAMFATRHGR